jgi:NAD(P)H-hydrate epimerase
MSRADAYAVSSGVSGDALMQAAGEAAAQEIRRRWSVRPVLVLCGPGNNGGDGYVVARRLMQAGWPVRLAALEPSGDRSPEAAAAKAAWTGPVARLSDARLGDAALVVDGLFGAGLSRPLEGDAARLAMETAAAGVPVAALDVPSGIAGDAARAIGPAFAAALTVTFHRLKPAHVLEPARSACGAVVCADIGIPPGWTQAAGDAEAQLNEPGVFAPPALELGAETHKHRRGRLVVLTGGAGSTGAARIAAAAGLAGGAGLATLLCPGSALQEVAASTRSELTVKLDPARPFGEMLDACRAEAAVLGPAAGVSETLAARVLEAASSGLPLVLDADALTSFEADPQRLFTAVSAACVLTPHEGEFARLFPDLRASRDAGAPNKIDRAKAAARRAGCTVLLKGADTVIAAPDGRARVNTHAAPALATAGAGDALAGLIGAGLAQGMDSFEAACAMAWIHGEAGRRMGPGASAETLLHRLPDAMLALQSRLRRMAALTRLRSLSP